MRKKRGIMGGRTRKGGESDDIAGIREKVQGRGSLPGVSVRETVFERICLSEVRMPGVSQDIHTGSVSVQRMSLSGFMHGRDDTAQNASAAYEMVYGNVSGGHG